MLGSTSPFGVSSSTSPFGSPSVFGRKSNSTPFGSRTGASVFGGTLTGVFGTDSSSLESKSPFGVPSSPAFGNSIAASVAPSTLTFGSSSPSFNGSSTCGLKPASGGFASSSNEMNSRGDVFQTHTTLDSGPFASSSTFGVSNKSAFGDARFPAFGTPSVGFANSPALGSFTSIPSNTAFVVSNEPPFGFGLGDAFRASNICGRSNSPVFGASNTYAFGSSSSPTFGTSSNTGLGFGSPPSFGHSTPGSGSSSLFGATPSFRVTGNASSGTRATTLTIGSTTFGPSAFCSQCGGSRIAAYSKTVELDGGSQTKIAAELHSLSAMNVYKDKSHEELRWQDYQSGDKGGIVGQSAGGIGIGGSVSSFGPSPTLAALLSSNPSSSTSPLPFAPLTSSNPFAPCSNSNPFAPHTSNTLVPLTFSPNHFCPPTSSSTLALLSAYPFSSSTSCTPFAPLTSSNPFAPRASANPLSPQTSFPNPFSNQTSSSNPVSPDTNSFAAKTPVPDSLASLPSRPSTNLGFTTSSANSLKATSYTPSPFITASAPAFQLNTFPSLFSTSSSPVFGPSPSIFCRNSTLRADSGSALSSINTKSCSVSSSVAPSFTTTNALFLPSSSFAPSFSEPSIIPGPSTASGWANLFTNTPSLLSASNPTDTSQQIPSFSTPALPTQTAQITGTFASSNFPLSSAANLEIILGSSDLVGTAGVLGQQSTVSQPSAICSTLVVQPAPVKSPFGDLPAMPQLSVGHHGSTTPIQYGISSMPVLDKPAASVRLSSLLMSRHLSRRRLRVPARKYDPKSDGSKVPFFSNGEEKLTASKAEALCVPRENPRALVINPAEQWPQRPNTDKMSPLLHASIHIYKNANFAENLGENSTRKESTSLSNSSEVPNELYNSTVAQKGALHVTLSGCKAGEVTTQERHKTVVEALIPEFRCSEYYTEPGTRELAAKERAEPGFCCRVRNFVVGRHGYGSIKFLGETDVRHLDLDSHVQFNYREVIVYMDESRKPPVGQGLNKSAEVTLLNIKCIDKKTGKQYKNGPRVDKYREMLIKKATEQGAEFVSYDPVAGEWKFRVQHFSRYEFMVLEK